MTPVTVVMAAYNHERFVGKTLDSLLAQTHAPIDCLVFDDGSTDGTAAAVRAREAECRARFRSFELVVKANEGISRTFNRGIDRARSEFVFLVSSDDVFGPRQIEESLVRAQAAADIGLVAADAEFIDDEDRPVTLSTFGVPYRRFVPCHASRVPGFDVRKDFGSYRSFLYANYLPPGVLLRKPLFEKAGLFRETFALEDHDAWMRLAKVARFALIDEPMSRYRLHAGAAHLKKAVRISGELVRLMVGEREYAAARGLEADWINACYLAFGHLALKAARAPDPAAAFAADGGDWWEEFRALLSAPAGKRAEPAWGEALGALADKAISAAGAAAADAPASQVVRPAAAGLTPWRKALFSFLRALYFRFPRTAVCWRVGFAR